MYRTLADVTKEQKYLKLNQKDEFILNYHEPLKIIDFHTHLSNLIPSKKGHPERNSGKPLEYPTLPPLNKLNFDVPYWTNFESKDMKGISAVFKHAIYGYRIYKDIIKNGSFENCFRSQDENMVQKNVLLPLSSKKCDISMNALKTAEKYPDRFIPFCSVHPFADNVKEQIFQHKQNGAKGYKVKISELELKDNFEPLLNVFNICYDANLPVILHTGAITSLNYENMVSLQRKIMNSTRVKLFGELLSHLPDDFVFIFGHSGIGEYELVAEYMQKHPATYTEVSCQTANSIKYLINKVGSNRILYGSDWPCLPQSFTISRVLLATEDNIIARDDILYKNAIKVLRVDL